MKKNRRGTGGFFLPGGGFALPSLQVW